MKIELETKVDDEDERNQLDLSDAATTLDKHKVLFSEECSSLYSDQRKRKRKGNRKRKRKRKRKGNRKRK